MGKSRTLPRMKSYTPFDSVQLVFSGNHYFEVLKEMIASAKEVIHLQTYILADDETGEDIITSLEAAARKGVQVSIMADGFGSSDISEQQLQRLNLNGMQFRLFSPMFSPESGVLGRRLHHKIVVIDKTSALVGGINISNKYKGSKETFPWLDYAVKIEGKCCGFLHILCEKLMQRKPAFMVTSLPSGNNKEKALRFRRNDWMWGKNEIENSYLQGIKGAKKRITMVASYFVPGLYFIRQMEKAVKRGVKISLIVTRETDTPFFRLSEKYLHPYLIRAGVDIYEWPDSVVHGKAMVIDGQWTTIGSYNINYLSHYRSIELNVDLDCPEFSNIFDIHLEKIKCENCIPVSAQTGHRPFGIFYNLLTLLVYHVLRLLMNWFMPIKRYKKPLDEKK